MDRYIGIKVIEAREAWRCKWQENGKEEIIVGGAEAKFQDIFVASADTAEFGYKVRYENGYESWSPKQVFDDAYFSFPDDCNIKAIWDYDELQPHQQRVVDEQVELRDKLSKLEEFVKGEMFRSLDRGEQHRLSKQAQAMQVYESILLDRIKNFNVT